MHAGALQPFHAQNTHTQGHSPERSTENIAPQDPNLKPRTLKTKHKTPTPKNPKALRLEPLTGALRALEKTLEGAVTGANPSEAANPRTLYCNTPRRMGTES